MEHDFMCGDFQSQVDDMLNFLINKKWEDGLIKLEQIDDEFINIIDGNLYIDDDERKTYIMGKILWEKPEVKLSIWERNEDEYGFDKYTIVPLSNILYEYLNKREDGSAYLQKVLFEYL